MGASNWVHLEVDEIVKETEKAFLLRIDGEDDYWCPKSQICDPENYEEGMTDCTVSVTEWWANQEGLGE